MPKVYIQDVLHEGKTNDAGARVELESKVDSIYLRTQERENRNNSANYGTGGLAALLQ